MARTGKRNATLDKMTLKDFWFESLHFKRQFYLSVFVPIHAILFNTVLPFLIGKILAGLIQSRHNLTGYIVAFIIVGIVAYITNLIGFRNFLDLQPRVFARLQNKVFSMLIKRGTSFHNNQVSGKLVNDAVDYPSAYQQMSSLFVTDLLPFVFGLLSGLIVIFVSSPPLGVVMLIMTAVAIGSGITFRQRMRPLRIKRLKARQKMISHLADSIVNVQAVKTFAREKDEQKQQKKLAGDFEEQQLFAWRLLAVDGSYRIGSLIIFEVIFILLLVWLVDRDPTILATGIFAFSYTISLSNRLFQISAFVRGIEQNLEDAEPMAKALQDDMEVQDVAHAPDISVTNGAITFDKVGFRYNDNSGENNVFKDLSVSITPGERVGLVGPSGGGKSTITKLLLRFEDIQEGAISIDDQNIAQVTQGSLRSSIAFVPQESLLFHRNIKENIAYGMPSANNDVIIDAAKKAYAHEFIEKLPDGYDTVVGERGVKLSGGQRQRIAIARAILKDAPILILDEATSALDSESEQHIQDALWELMQGRTAIVIAHRLSTIQKLDRIIVLDNGKIVEDGSHNQLIGQDGLYSRLWKRQSGSFIED